MATIRATFEQGRRERKGAEEGQQKLSRSVCERCILYASDVAPNVRMLFCMHCLMLGLFLGLF